MYQGGRDPMLGITVRQAMCSPLTDGSGVDWVEIFVPPEHPVEYYGPWSSIVVPPDQVYRLDSYYNEFFVNARTSLTLCEKDLPGPNGVRPIVAKSVDMAENVLARFLLYELYTRQGPAACRRWTVPLLRADFERSGLKMLPYILRMGG